MPATPTPVPSAHVVAGDLVGSVAGPTVTMIVHVLPVLVPMLAVFFAIRFVWYRLPLGTQWWLADKASGRKSRAPADDW